MMHTWANSPSDNIRKPGRTLKRLLMCRSPQIFYLPIAKSGSTFVKNVLWAIENGTQHPHPKLIHRNNEKFLRASESGATVEDVRTSEAAFVVFRDPISRFLSLYFDKVVGDGANRFVPLRDHLIRKHHLKPLAESDDDHRWNTRALAEFINLNLLENGGLRANPHWTPQSRRSSLIAAVDLKVVISDQMDEQLRFMLRPVLPNIDDVLSSAERNRSKKVEKRSGLLETETMRLVKEIYAMDSAIYRVARDEWQSTGQIPRFSRVFPPLQ